MVTAPRGSSKAVGDEKLLKGVKGCFFAARGGYDRHESHAMAAGEKQVTPPGYDVSLVDLYRFSDGLVVTP